MVVRGGSTVILVVEDDEVLRGAARDALEDVGYRVLEAGDASRAIEICDGDAAIDLVLSDIVMPRISGIVLAKQLRERRPALKVLWMSGCSAGKLETDAITGYLEKPFTAEVLVERVRTLLA